MAPLHRTLQRADPDVAAVDRDPLAMAQLIINPQPQLPGMLGAALNRIGADRSQAQPGGRPGFRNGQENQERQ